jgi:hypothetical protein
MDTKSIDPVHAQHPIRNPMDAESKTPEPRPPIQLVLPFCKKREENYKKYCEMGEELKKAGIIDCY